MNKRIKKKKLMKRYWEIRSQWKKMKTPGYIIIDDPINSQKKMQERINIFNDHIVKSLGMEPDWFKKERICYTFGIRMKYENQSND